MSQIKYGNIQNLCVVLITPIDWLIEHFCRPLLVTAWFISDSIEHSFSYTYQSLIMNKIRLVGTRKLFENDFVTTYPSRDLRNQYVSYKLLLNRIFFVVRQTRSNGRKGEIGTALLHR